MIKSLSLVWLGTLLSLPVGLAQDIPTTPLDRSLPEGVEAHEGIVYVVRGADRELALDLYRPAGVDKSEALPTVVLIHGGGWFQGSRESFQPLAMQLARQGYVTATISYRLSGEAVFPAALDDCQSAIAFLEESASDFGIDPDRIGVMGLSAGGHLAALLAVVDPAIRAAVPMGAQTDLQSERIAELSRAPQNPHYRPFLGGTIDEVPEQYRAASPFAHLDASDPPFLFLSGELDDPSTHADRFRQKCDELGIEQSVYLIPDAPHAFAGREPFFSQMMAKLLPFFATHLRD